MIRDRVEEIFAQDGLLSKVLAPAFEWRPQQGEMARLVTDALEYGGVVLVEAPTGVGKSASYLVPAVLWAVAEDEPVVISTHTKNLQDQILENEVPKIRRMVNREVRAIMLKGRTNYLCRNRWNDFIAESEGTADGERFVRAVSYWVDTTETGDLSEAPSVSSRDRALLGRISSERRFCASSRCSAENGCFYKASRKLAKDAHVIVVNHALLMSDIFGAGGGLPEYTNVVIDEAHHLPEVAAGPLSFGVTEPGCESALRGLGGRGEPGLTDDLRRILRLYATPDVRQGMLTQLRERETETGKLLELSRRFWDDLRAHPQFPRGTDRVRYGLGSSLPELGLESGNELAQSWRGHLLQLGHRVDQVGLFVDDSGAERDPAPLREAKRRLENARETLHHFEELLSPTARGSVFWMDPAPALRTAPLEVGEALRDAFFDKKRSVILTSATFAVRDSLAHMSKKLGLREDAFEGRILETPFALPDQVQAWVHSRLPDPNQPDFVPQMSEGIVQLASDLKRKMLVLFTSLDMLRRVADTVEPDLTARGIRLHAQGMRQSRKQIRSEFLADGAAVLLGAASFWEGVDFPGEELEVLVLARLPFLVPSDPLVRARAERIEAEGGDSFSSYYLPEAILRFRQGFGRLIRRREDRGLFVVCDSRLSQRSYGRQYQKSVGVPFRAAQSWGEIVDGGTNWFASSD